MICVYYYYWCSCMFFICYLLCSMMLLISLISVFYFLIYQYYDLYDSIFIISCSLLFNQHYSDDSLLLYAYICFEHIVCYSCSLSYNYPFCILNSLVVAYSLYIIYRKYSFYYFSILQLLFTLSLSLIIYYILDYLSFPIILCDYILCSFCLICYSYSLYLLLHSLIISSFFIFNYSLSFRTSSYFDLQSLCSSFIFFIYVMYETILVSYNFISCFSFYTPMLFITTYSFLQSSYLNIQTILSSVFYEPVPNNLDIPYSLISCSLSFSLSCQFYSHK